MSGMRVPCAVPLDSSVNAFPAVAGVAHESVVTRGVVRPECPCSLRIKGTKDQSGLGLCPCEPWITGRGRSQREPRRGSHGRDHSATRRWAIAGAVARVGTWAGREECRTGRRKRRERRHLPGGAAAVAAGAQRQRAQHPRERGSSLRSGHEATISTSRQEWGPRPQAALLTRRRQWRPSPAPGEPADRAGRDRWSRRVRPAPR